MQILAAIFAGAFAGYGYWKIYGCRSGICLIGQNKFMSIITGALVGLLFITSQGCSNAENGTTQTTLQPAGEVQAIQNAKVNEEISPDAFMEKLKDPSFIVLDVRTPEEFKTGHLANAVNINYNAPDFAAEVNKLDKSKTYLVYCQRGARSAGASGVMAGNGFNTIYSLRGGLNAWTGELVK